MNRNDPLNPFEDDIPLSQSPKVELTFIVDTSSFMEEYDKDKNYLEIAKNIVSMLKEGDRASVICGDMLPNTLQPLTENMEDVNTALEQIEPGPLGLFYCHNIIGMPLLNYKSAQEYDKTDIDYKEEAAKIFILIAAGRSHISTEPYLEHAFEKGIKIYTVGVGDYYDRAYMKNIAYITGGSHYHSDDVEGLYEELESIIKGNIDISKDSDGDGISDYHEDRIRIFKKEIIKMDKYNPDTDGDFLKDGQEIIQRVNSKGRIRFSYRTNPSKKDTDGDGLDDYIDLNPRAYDKYKIDFLGSYSHLETFKLKVKRKEEEYKKLRENIPEEMPEHAFERLMTAFKLNTLIEDYYIFLEERGIDYKNMDREEYWQKNWDTCWGGYCSYINRYVNDLGVVAEELHYFRNNLNRMPDTLEELVNDRTNIWYLMRVGTSLCHMYESDFSGSGLYNLKIMSYDGRNEGVYVNIYADEETNNRGYACTAKTDSKNMGTYNYYGEYFKYKSDASKQLKHFTLDMVPYSLYGNVSKDDLPKDWVPIKSIADTWFASNNRKRYDATPKAAEAREKFLKEWRGYIE